MQIDLTLSIEQILTWIPAGMVVILLICMFIVLLGRPNGSDG